MMVTDYAIVHINLFSTERYQYFARIRGDALSALPFCHATFRHLPPDKPTTADAPPAYVTDAAPPAAR